MFCSLPTCGLYLSTVLHWLRYCSTSARKSHNCQNGDFVVCSLIGSFTYYDVLCLDFLFSCTTTIVSSTVQYGSRIRIYANPSPADASVLACMFLRFEFEFTYRFHPVLYRKLNEFFSLLGTSITYTSLEETGRLRNTHSIRKSRHHKSFFFYAYTHSIHV